MCFSQMYGRRTCAIIIAAALKSHIYRTFKSEGTSFPAPVSLRLSPLPLSNNGNCFDPPRTGFNYFVRSRPRLSGAMETRKETEGEIGEKECRDVFFPCLLLFFTSVQEVPDRADRNVEEKPENRG